MSEPIKLFGELSEYYPEPEAGDRVVSAASSLAGLVPGHFDTLTGLVNAWLGPPLEKRKERWCKMLADVVQELCDRFQGFDPNELNKNEKFVSAVVEASHIAVSTHQAAKLEMLRNALIKIGSGEGPNEDLQQVYFRIIDALTPSHIQVLFLIWTAVSQMAQRPQNPLAQGTTYSPLMGEQFPELLSNRELLDHIIRDLNDFHLVENRFPGRVFPDVPTAPNLITNDGINFLKFIMAPENLPK